MGSFDFVIFLIFKELIISYLIFVQQHTLLFYSVFTLKALGINSFKTVIFFVGTVLNCNINSRNKELQYYPEDKSILDVLNILRQSLFFKSSSQVIALFFKE